MANSGGNGRRDGAMRQLLLKQEQRLDAKVTQITRKMRQTL